MKARKQLMVDTMRETGREDAGSALKDEATHRRTRRHGSEPDSDHRSAGYGEDNRPGPTNGFWRAADWLYCRDEKWRPVEPGTFPLAHGVPARVGQLRAYGNAIVPQVAAQVIKTFMEYRPCTNNPE
jgi:DNA (cytosine-5)-methyltransferase 1